MHFTNIYLLLNGSETISDDFWISFQKQIENIFLPQIDFGFDRPYEEKDFTKYILQAEEEICIISDILQKVQIKIPDEFEYNESFKNCIISLILLVGEHHSISLWNTEKIRNASLIIKKNTLKLCKSDTLISLLFDLKDNSKIFNIYEDILNKLRPKLLKDTWKKYPGAITSFNFLFFQAKFPYLGEYLQSTLPTCLVLIDDFETENRIQGILLLNHLITNVTKTELSWLGQDLVIYNALEHMLYVHEKTLIKPLIGCLILILKHLEDGFVEEDKNLQWSRYDDCFSRIIQSTELEQNLEMRILYLESLIALIESMGISVIRWGGRLLSVLENYLEVGCMTKNMKEMSLTLKILDTYTKIAWIRIPYNYEPILIMLIKLVYDISDSKENNSLIIENALKILKEITICDPKALEMLNDIKANCEFNQTTIEILNKIF